MTRSFTLCFVVWVAAGMLNSGLAAQGAPANTTSQAAQIEKGRAVVAQVCTTCHTTLGRMIQVHKLTPEQWKDTVYFMISRGAQVMPDEIDAVTAFLAATAGRGGPAGPQANQAGGRGRAGGGGNAGQAAGADGAALLQRNCQQCHELAIASKKLESEEWGAVISRMINYGARLTPADQQTLVAYLTGRP